LLICTSINFAVLRKLVEGSGLEFLQSSNSLIAGRGLYVRVTPVDERNDGGATDRKFVSRCSLEGLAPYLTSKALHQLPDDFREKLPPAAAE
jgi:hypothetical protein